MESELMRNINDEITSTKKKKKRKKQNKDKLVDKLNNKDCESECVTETISLDNASEKSKRKKHKRRHDSEDSDKECKVETGGKRKLKEKNARLDDLPKKQKTDDIKETNQLSCEIGADDKKLKLKRKKEISVLTDLPLDGCKNVEPLKKRKKSKGGESGASEIIQDSLSAPLEDAEVLFDGSKQKKHRQKQNVNIHLGNDEEMNGVTRHNNLSNIGVEESTGHIQKKKKKKKHSKHRDTLSIEEPDVKVHKNKQKSKKAKLEKYLGKVVETQDVTNTEDIQIVSSDCVAENANQRKRKKKGSSHKDASSRDESEHSLRGKKQESGDATCDRGNSHGNVNGGILPVHLSKQKSVPGSVVNQNKDSSVKNETSQLNIYESPPSDQTHLKKATTISGPVQGQWQGSLFESSERQNKFLRLLGGMKKSSDSSGDTEVAKKNVNGPAGSVKKKGLFGSLTSMVGPSGGNSAMSTTAAANLNQKLEDEYNKAMNFKLSGKVGTGFGFMPDPAEGKKFHIDVHKSKSIKFDD